MMKALLALCTAILLCFATQAQEAEIQFINIDDEIEITSGGTLQIDYEIQELAGGVCTIEARFVPLKNGNEVNQSYPVHQGANSVTLNLPIFNVGSEGILYLTFVEAGNVIGKEKIFFDVIQ